MSMRSDSLAVTAGIVVILGATAATGPTLREWTSAVSVVCVLGLIWRGLSTVKEMSFLARALVTVLAIQLTSAAAAQLLLVQELKALPPQAPAPPNTLGLCLVLLARLLVLLLIVFWPWWLNRWEDTPPRPRQSRGPVVP